VRRSRFEDSQCGSCPINVSWAASCQTLRCSERELLASRAAEALLGQLTRSVHVQTDRQCLKRLHTHTIKPTMYMSLHQQMFSNRLHYREQTMNTSIRRCRKNRRDNDQVRASTCRSTVASLAAHSLTVTKGGACETLLAWERTISTVLPARWQLCHVFMFVVASHGLLHAGICSSVRLLWTTACSTLTELYLLMLSTHGHQSQVPLYWHARLQRPRAGTSGFERAEDGQLAAIAMLDSCCCEPGSCTLHQLALRGGGWRPLWLQSLPLDMAETTGLLVRGFA
jgi:hypothetical protein